MRMKDGITCNTPIPTLPSPITFNDLFIEKIKTDVRLITLAVTNTCYHYLLSL